MPRPAGPSSADVNSAGGEKQRLPFRLLLAPRTADLPYSEKGFEKMSEHLYRFRSTAFLLGEKYQELDRQEIYCASLKDLNDPMEGFKDLFWSGDKIVWVNLLKHYLLCLDRACFLFMLNGNTKVIDFASMPVLETENDLPTQKWKDTYKEICDRFFGTPSVAEYADKLPSRKGPMRRYELHFHLRTLHYHALNAVVEAYRHLGVMIDGPEAGILRDLCERKSIKPEVFEITNSLEERHPDIVDGSDQLYAVLYGASMQAALIAKYNSPASSNDHNRALIFLDFPDQYVRALEQMLYIDWYTACFSGNCVNSSMWGHYADNHRGVCLKFRTGTNAGNPSIPLYGITGWRGNRTMPNPVPTHGYNQFQLHKIVYKKTYPEFDFFRSLGRLRGPALGWWYSDGKGNNSSCCRDVFDSEAQWREKYWAGFEIARTTKLEDWAYEDEYRLVLTSFLTDYSNPLNKKLKYKFEDLSGIIFGINTSEEDKLSIIRIIQAKCKQEQRKEFEFHQAYYSRKAGKIDVSPLNLIQV